MSTVMCVVALEDDSSVSLVIPQQQDVAFYATIAGMVLRECLDQGVTMEMVEAVMNVINSGEVSDVKRVPEPIIMG